MGYDWEGRDRSLSVDTNILSHLNDTKQLPEYYCTKYLIYFKGYVVELHHNKIPCLQNTHKRFREGEVWNVSW